MPVLRNCPFGPTIGLSTVHWLEMLSGGKSVLTVFVNASPDLEAVQLDNWVHLGLPDETRVPSQNYYIDTQALLLKNTQLKKNCSMRLV